MSTFSSIKLNRSISHLKKLERKEGTDMKTNYNNFIERNSGLSKIAYSNGVQNLNNEFKNRDANTFRAIEDEESKKHLEQAKFFKKINDENKEDKKQMLNIPKVIKKSEDELAKIHMVDRNSNSGLTKLAYSDGVHDLNDEFKKRDEDNFRILRNENMKKDIAKAKFFKNINHENRAKEKEELMNLPKIVRKSEDELAKIHMAESFLQRGIRDAALINKVNDSPTLKNHQRKKEDDVNNKLIKPKEQKEQKEIHMTNDIATKHQKKDLKGKKVLVKKLTNQNSIHNDTRILPDINKIDQHAINKDKEMNDDVIKPREKKFSKEVSATNDMAAKHKIKVIDGLKKIDARSKKPLRK